MILLKVPKNTDSYMPCCRKVFKPKFYTDEIFKEHLIFSIGDSVNPA